MVQSFTPLWGVAKRRLAYTLPMKIAGVLAFAILILMLAAPARAQAPQPQVVEGPNVKVLTGLTAQQFQEEMNFIVQSECGPHILMLQFRHHDV